MELALDNLKEAIGKDKDQYKIIHNKGEKSFLGNFVYLYNYLKKNKLVNKEDIIIEIDADDWLLDCFVLDVINKDYQRVRIKIAFNPIEEKFEVQTPVIVKDKQWIPDISEVLSGQLDSYTFINTYIQNNPEAEQNNKVNYKISGNRQTTTMDRVYSKIFNNN